MVQPRWPRSRKGEWSPPRKDRSRRGMTLHGEPARTARPRLSSGGRADAWAYPPRRPARAIDSRSFVSCSRETLCAVSNPALRCDHLRQERRKPIREQAHFAIRRACPSSADRSCRRDRRWRRSAAGESGFFRRASSVPSGWRRDKPCSAAGDRHEAQRSVASKRCWP